MPDGQDKSDDLIAELAKLMASGPGGPETPANPAPKLVTLPDPAPVARPAAIRIPGMDAPIPAPVAAAPRTPDAAQANRPAKPPTPTADRPATPAFGRPAVTAAPPSPSHGVPQAPTAATTPAAAPFTLRIPGMEAPVTIPPPATTAPVAERPVSTPAPRAPEPAPRPPQQASWQDRETPRAPEPRPTVERRPELRPAPPTTMAPVVQRPEMPAPLKMPTPTPKAEPKLDAEPAPASGVDDLRDFDFVIDRKPLQDDQRPPAYDPLDELLKEQLKQAAPPAPPRGLAPSTAPAPKSSVPVSPEPVSPEPVSSAPHSSAPKPAAPKSSAGDAIAELIAADLDAMEGTRPAPAPIPVPPPVAPSPARIGEARPRTSSPLPPRAMPQLRTAGGSADSDRFATAPMSGPTSRSPAPMQAPPQAQPEPTALSQTQPVAPTQPQPAPAAPQPAMLSDIPLPPVTPIERDPMDEIESLIGEAVRVELTGGDRRSAKPVPSIAVPEAPQPQPQPTAPIVPPLTTGFAPRRAALKDAEPSIPASEAAILAAAAAGSAEIGSVEPMIAAPPAARPKARPERRGFSGGMRQYVGMAVAGVLLVAALFGLYWVLGMNQSGDTEAPVLQADGTPVKQTPPATTSPSETEGSVVFNELDGTSTSGDEQIVSRDDSTDTPIADLAQPVGDDAAASESELANRKVRTVTVRPDGSIVSGDDAVAGGQELPVDRPDVPAIAGADVQPSELLASVPTDTGATIDAGATGAVDSLAAITPSPGAVIDPTIVAPIPLARPTNRSTMVGGSQWQAPAGAAASSPMDLAGGSSTQATVSTGSGAYAQLSSQKTTGDAQTALATAQRRLGPLLNGASLEIRRVDLGARGVWYRVVLPTNSFQDATQACAIIKANGSDCVPNG